MKEYLGISADMQMRKYLEEILKNGENVFFKIIFSVFACFNFK